MVKINWSVYLLLGVGILFASYKLNLRTASRDFTLFIWLGYLFLVIGVAKLVFWFITSKKESSFDKKEMRREIYQRISEQREAGRYCMRCGIPLRGNENFCPRCGQRQKMRI